LIVSIRIDIMGIDAEKPDISILLLQLQSFPSVETEAVSSTPEISCLQKINFPFSPALEP